MTFPRYDHPGRVSMSLSLDSTDPAELQSIQKVLPTHLYYGCSEDEMRDAVNDLLAAVHLLTNIVRDEAENPYRHDLDDIHAVVAAEVWGQLEDHKFFSRMHELNETLAEVQDIVDTKRGPAGKRGPQGEPGPPGPKGDRGVPGVPGMGAEEKIALKARIEDIKDLELRVSDLEEELDNA